MTPDGSVPTSVVDDKFNDNLEGFCLNDRVGAFSPTGSNNLRIASASGS